MTATEILKLIETVSPDDTAKLDEIDARVFLFLKPTSREDFQRCPRTFKPILVDNGKISWGCKVTAPEYTRSRDALKQIRPDGFKTWAFFDGYKEGAKYRAEMFTSEMLDEQNRTMKEIIIQTGWLPTEELAELHAIISAIEYERNGK